MVQRKKVLIQGIGPVLDAASVQKELLAEGFVTVPEVARYLKLSKSKVYLLMDGGSLPFAKFGKSRRIPRRAMHQYAQRCLIGVAGFYVAWLFSEPLEDGMSPATDLANQTTTPG